MRNKERSDTNYNYSSSIVDTTSSCLFEEQYRNEYSYHENIELIRIFNNRKNIKTANPNHLFISKMKCLLN